MRAIKHAGRACDPRVLAYLLDLYSLQNKSGVDMAANLARTAAETAARRGHVEVFTLAHRTAHKLANGPCYFDGVVRLAILGGHIDVIRAALDVRGYDNCSIQKSLGFLDAASRFQSFHVARWYITEHVRPGHRRRVVWQWLRDAAERDTVPAFELAYALGGVLTAQMSDALQVAASYGSIDVLRWAGGARYTGDGQSAEDVMPPVVEWCPDKLVWAAALTVRGANCVLPWLARRVDCRPSFTSAMVRVAARRGLVLPALIAHREGLVPIGSWNALETAARYCGRAGAVSLVHAGALFTPHALAAALTRPSFGLARLMIARFGAEHIIGAAALADRHVCAATLADQHVRAIDGAWFKRVASAFPGLCMREALLSFEANNLSSTGEACPPSEFSCACPSCSRAVPSTTGS